MGQGSTVTKDGIRVVKGTPTAPITRSILVLRLWRTAAGPQAAARTMASLHVVRPGPSGYVVKELIPPAELEPNAALEKAVAIARRGDVTEVYVNADLTKLPKPRAALG